MTVTKAQPPRTMRLVSGVFYKTAPLSHGINGLAANGFRRREMCFVGTRDALANLHGAMIDAPRKLRPIYDLSGEIEVMGTAGVLLAGLEKAARREKERGLHASGPLFGLFERFSEHICCNAIVLTVSAADSGLLQSGSLILLQHSAHPIQTHEFTLARPGASGSIVVQEKN